MQVTYSIPYSVFEHQKHYFCVRSVLLRDIEDADDAITTADREHLTRIAEVGGEAGTRQIVDAIAWLKEAVTVEDFDFVGSRATSQNQIVRVLLELSRVELHWGSGGQFFVEWDVFREFSRAQVPKLELVLLGVLSSQNETIMNINRVTSNEWSNNTPDALARANVPNLDVLIPTARDDKVRVLTDKFGAEDTIGMAWEATTTAFHSFGQLSSLFVIHSDLGIFTTCEELLSILLVISCQKLVHRVVDLVQLATGSSMEMEQTTLSIGRDHHIFSNSRSLQWSPPTHSKKQVSILACRTMGSLTSRWWLA